MTLNPSQIVHRDVKLENVVIDEHQNVKLIDFGLAGDITPGERMGVYCGSPSYAAPEICSKRSALHPSVY
jgi:Neu-associated kinase